VIVAIGELRDTLLERMTGMARRVLALALNTYREAVRARILLGLFALALATALYSIAVGEFALKNAPRVVSDLGAASISLYSIAVAIVMGATSLYRELEQKTIFPVLARPTRRAEYLAGKYAGTVLTLVVFIAADAAVVLLILARHGGRSFAAVAGAAAAMLLSPLLVAWRWPNSRTYLPIPWALVSLAVAAVLASGAIDDRRVVLGASALALLEVMIVSGVALLFSAFSSPFLTAVFTIGVFIVGRESETLARLPARVFGETVKRAGVFLAAVVPNLSLYVPPRPLLTGEGIGGSFAGYLGLAALQAAGWSVGLLILSAWIFQRRDLL
jgi:ABC-type transport system involved in multi-copper enzyme maturation permease subunit